MKKKESTEGTAFSRTSNESPLPPENISDKTRVFLVPVKGYMGRRNTWPTTTQVMLINLIPFRQSRCPDPPYAVESKEWPFDIREKDFNSFIRNDSSG